MKELLIPMLKRHEGLRLKAYHCSEGILTIGYGHTGKDVFVGQVITEARAEELLIKDLQTAFNDAETFSWYARLNDARKAAVVNMLFNLGITRFKGFVCFRLAMSEGKWKLAADEMLDSRWAHQVGDGKGGRMDRAEELSNIILFGRI